MAKYNPPEGYLFDENSGLYYSQIIADDEQGNPSQIVTWFDADTGEYHREIYLIEDEVREETEDVSERESATKDSSPKKGESKSMGKTIVIIIAAVAALAVIVAVVFLLIRKKGRASDDFKIEISGSEEEEIDTPFEKDDDELFEETEGFGLTSNGMTISGGTLKEFVEPVSVRKNSENSITVFLKTEYINQLTFSEISDDGKKIDTEIMLSFYSDDGQRRAELMLNALTWNFCLNKDADIIGSCNGEAGDLRKENGAVFFEINYVGVGEEFEHLNSYELVFLVYDNSEENRTIASGNLSDISLSSEFSGNDATFMYSDDMELMITLRNPAIIDHVKTDSDKNLYIDLFGTQADMDKRKPAFRLYVEYSTDVGVVFLYSMDVTEDENGNMTIGIGEDYGIMYVQKTYVSIGDDNVVAVYVCENLPELLNEMHYFTIMGSESTILEAGEFKPE